MRLYEVVYILDAALDEGAVDKKLDELHKLATGKDGEIKAVDHWGVRQLAYAIDKKRSGYYVVAQLVANPVDLVEFERLVRLDEEVMRYLLVLNVGEPTTGMSIMAEVRSVPAAAADDDDDHDDDDHGPDRPDRTERTDRTEPNDGDGDDDEPRRDDDSPPEFQGGRGMRRRHEGPAVRLLNYKDVSTLSRFLTEQGKILPKRTTKVSAPFQRQLGRAVKRARYLALIPYVRDHEA